MSSTKVIDLSHWNPTPDWDALKASGILGVIHKATESDSYVDPTLFSRGSAAMNAGLAWATYHFLRPGDMAVQMQHYLDTIDPQKGERVCLDHEDSGVSLEQLRQAVEILVSHPAGLQVAVYSGSVIKEQLGHDRDDYLADNTSLWLAHYSSTPDWPEETWPQWSLWQYTDRFATPAVNQPVDGNKWNGSDDNLIKWFGPADAIEPGPEPGPAPEPGMVTLAVEGDVNLVVMVSGIQVYPK